MKFEIKFNDLEQANKFAAKMKDENLRGVKVSQKLGEPEQGALGVEEFLPEIMMVIKSGLATAVVTQVFGLLKGFLTAKSNERIENAKLAHDKNKIEFDIECGGKKLAVKLTKGSEEEMKGLIETIQRIEREC